MSDSIADPPDATTAVAKVKLDEDKSATVETAVKLLALFEVIPLVTRYSIVTILPSASCFPIAPSPKKISYLRSSTSCKK